MVPSYDPALDLIYIGTSVTAPAPKYRLWRAWTTRTCINNSTLALNGDSGEIAWHYQHT